MTVSFSSDSAQTARCRVNLKLGAIAYADARHGTSPDRDLTGPALSHLCELAALYYASLTGSGDVLRRSPSSLGASEQLVRLCLASISYACARHGADACVELSRDALGNLCGAAIAYCEMLVGADPAAPRVVDRGLQLGGGA